MSDGRNTASQYLTRAEQLRALAEQIEDAESRRLLLAVAGEYEEMAEQAAQR